MIRRPFLALVAVLFLLGHPASASPASYMKAQASAAVQNLYFGQASSQERALLQDDEVYCGTPDPNDPMWFTQGDGNIPKSYTPCSKASQDNFAYIDTSGNFRTANKGDLIQFACDGVFCPLPPTPDCYRFDGVLADAGEKVCPSGQFCHIEQHARWGFWATGEDGKTFDAEVCSPERWNFDGLTPTQAAALRASFKATCDVGLTWDAKRVSEIYKPVHGRCHTYRQLEQTCNPLPLEYDDSRLDPAFIRAEDGKVFERPLVCDPRGGKDGSRLVCTGPDFDVMPSTCVQARPKDQCFSGPWWYSKNCPRTAPEAPAAGLTRDQAIDAWAVALTLFPGDVAFSATCVFWDESTLTGRRVALARKQMYLIGTKLWPDKAIAGPVPSFNEVLARIPGVAIVQDSQRCYAGEQVEGSEVASILAAIGLLSSQPNQIWSLVHFLMHNQPAPMTPARVEGSRAMASFLLENFWCTDCRGFFYQGIVSRYGMPPESNIPRDHARYWWWGHNVASEHVAAIRGGHPWIFGLGEEPFAPYQNPYFMPWGDAVAQWTVRPEDYYSATQGGKAGQGSSADKKHHAHHKAHDSKKAAHHSTPESEYEYPAEKTARHGKGHHDA